MKRRSVLAGAVAAAIAHPCVSFASNRVLGLTLPKTGVQAEVARDLELGYRIALESSDVELGLKVLDDESNPDKAAENVRLLAADSSVIALSGIVGTPHAQAALPVATKAGLPVVGIRSGASSLRTGAPGIFHLRSSFEDELSKVVTQCSGGGFQHLVVLYSNDSFGTASKDHLLKQMANSGINLLSAIPVERNGSNIPAACETASKQLYGSKVAAGVVLLLIANPMVQAVAELRGKHKIALPLFAMSFTATRTIATQPNPQLAGMGVVDAFPIPWSSRTPLALQFRADAKRLNKPEAIDSLTSLEGYFYGSVIARAAAHGGGRNALVKTLHSGITVAGQSINFDDNLVGYKFLEVVRKSTFDGRFKA